MENNKRSKILSGVRKLSDRQNKRNLKLKKQKDRLDKYVQRFTETKRIQKAINQHKLKKRIALYKKEQRNFTLESGVKITINARSRSAFIVPPEGSNIALPKGSYDYKQKTIVIDPDGTVKNIIPRKPDTLSPKIASLKKNSLNKLFKFTL